MCLNSQRYYVDYHPTKPEFWGGDCQVSGLDKLRAVALAGEPNLARVLPVLALQNAGAGVAISAAALGIPEETFRRKMGKINELGAQKKHNEALRVAATLAPKGKKGGQS